MRLRVTDRDLSSAIPARCKYRAVAACLAWRARTIGLIKRRAGTHHPPRLHAHWRFLFHSHGARMVGVRDFDAGVRVPHPAGRAHALQVRGHAVCGTSIIWISGFRFLTAALALAALAPLVIPARDAFEGFRRRDTWKTMLPMAFFGPFLATIFWTAGIKHLTAGRAAIYNQLSTAFIIILAALVLKEPMTVRKLIGVTLAAIGAVIVGMHQ